MRPNQIKVMFCRISYSDSSFVDEYYFTRRHLFEYDDELRTFYCNKELNNEVRRFAHSYFKRLAYCITFLDELAFCAVLKSQASTSYLTASQS